MIGLAFLAGPLAGAGEPDPIRIGVPYVPPPADVPAARLYTQDGFELDLAAEIGRQLGRKVALVPVSGEGAVDALWGGRIDLLLERQEVNTPVAAGIDTLPSGYASGLAVAMRTDTDIRSWPALAGRKLCVVASNARARRLARAVGAQEIVQPVPALALTRVRTGECDAAIHDEAVLQPLFGEAEWTKFSATLPGRDLASLVVALPAASTSKGEAIRTAVAQLAASDYWVRSRSQWAKNVALEVYLEQDAPDCH